MAGLLCDSQKNYSVLFINPKNICFKMKRFAKKSGENKFLRRDLYATFFAVILFSLFYCSHSYALNL